MTWNLSLVRDDLRRLLTLSGPVVLARLGIMTMGLTDAVVLGRYSAEQLGFHALAWAPTSVIVTMTVGLMVGVQVMTARAIGEGRRELIGAVLRRGLVYSFWIGVLSTGFLWLAGPPFLHAIGLEPALADGATPALMIFALSLPGQAIGVAVSFWLEGLSKPGPAAWAMWAANIVNLGLVLILAPGGFGVPAMGAVGAAWATTGARTFLAIAMLAYVALKPDLRALGVFRRAPRDRYAAREQRRIGYGAGTSNLLEQCAFASMNLIAGVIGGTVVAAWAIVLNVAAIVFMVPLGLSAGAAVLVGQAYGARDARGVTRAGLVALGVAAAFGGAAMLIVWLAAGPILHGYTTDPRTLALAIPGLALASLMLMPDSVQVVAAQVLRARGDVWVPAATHLTSYLVVMMPLAWWLAVVLGLGLTGIVLAAIGSSVLSGGLLLARFWMLSRRPAA